jgi:hypothetical protein
MSDDLSPSSPPPTAPHPDENAEKAEILGNFGNIWEIVDFNFSLTNPQLLAIQLAVQGLRWGQIAQRIGVTRRTIWNWRNENSDFQSALTEAIAQRQDTADQRTHAQAIRATEILSQIMENPHDKHRVRAAQIILNASFRLRPKPTTGNSDPDYEPWPEPVLEPKVG